MFEKNDFGALGVESPHGGAIKALVAKGFDVVVLARSQTKAAKLKLLGARVVLGDIKAPSTWKAELLSCRAVCHCAADKYSPCVGLW